MVSTRLYTIEDLEALPDDGHVWELIDGELRRRAPLGGRHGALGSRIDRRVGSFVEERALGETFSSGTTYVLRRDPDCGLRPSFSFVRADRLSEYVGFDKPLNLVPDLVAEILSPDDLLGTLEDKLSLYEHVGVPLIWIFWPRRRVVTVYAAGQPVREVQEGDELDGGEVLPGFRVAVADLFRVGLQDQE